MPDTPPADRQPFIVHCGACRHEWTAAYLPMEVAAFVRIVRGGCPSCGTTATRVFCGPAPAADRPAS